MNLREQLRSILPEILPQDPAEAIKGTELIRLVRLRLGDDYSDGTLRYHFSILSYDPGSPIAKVDQGQGYYLRLKRSAEVARAPGLWGLREEGLPEDDAAARMSRALAIYERLAAQRGQLAFSLNGAQGSPLEPRGHWELPDLVVADLGWEASPEDPERGDRALLGLRRHLGVPPCALGAVQLKLTLTLENAASEFFQALSATRWALSGELVVVEPLNDEALVEALRSLGHQFGIGVSVLGLPQATLDELPSARELMGMGVEAFEKVQEFMRPQRITVAAPRPRLDWQVLSALRKKHESVELMLLALAAQMERQQAEPPLV